MKYISNFLHKKASFRVTEGVDYYSREERQIRSLGDQVIECEKLVKSKGLTLLKRPVSPIEEKQSAKETDIRPKFRKMLEDI